MGFNSTTKEVNCLFFPASTGINLKIIMLSNRNQMKKSPYCKIPFIYNSRKCKLK